MNLMEVIDYMDQVYMPDILAKESAYKGALDATDFAIRHDAFSDSLRDLVEEDRLTQEEANTMRNPWTIKGR